VVLEQIDTAAPEAVDTAVAETLAPPTEVTQSPETAAPVTSETEQAPETPETESSPLSVLDSIDWDTLRDHPKVKDGLARETESARRKAEHAANEARAQADAAWVQSREYVDDLTNLVKAGVMQDDAGDVRVSIDPKKIEGFTQRLNTSNVRGLVGAISNIVDSQLSKDFTLTVDETTALRDSYAAFQSAPTAKAPEYLANLLSVYGRSAVEAAKADLTKEIETRIRKEFTSAAEAEKRKQAETNGRNAGGPTQVNGGAPGNYNLKTLKGLSAAKRDGTITEAQYLEGLNKL